jgi:hypothetical protein
MPYLVLPCFTQNYPFSGLWPQSSWVAPGSLRASLPLSSASIAFAAIQSSEILEAGKKGPEVDKKSPTGNKLNLKDGFSALFWL